ncbi:Non-reducing end beta-L-arabinofuranosidase [Aquisphaera giovannonii]|uniref:Non-reducing end beta-L-arabinofuranosidase n=1 Tax=Aquisphaera giovannonii TaxID=406548 RepID=A0A5B9WEL9_9BACT|nr:glycoside hydrolase family 127 protein [Aquisphaera giovannonii]QEH38495.1 Non-reducing end beta-L-arabinofuranosidase [Aquisphaera giovannonii]
MDRSRPRPVVLALTLASLGLGVGAMGQSRAADAAAAERVSTPAELYPLTSVRLLDGPFTAAVESNRRYLLAVDPDRLLEPFRREAGLKPRKPPYGNWESGGLDGHIAGHYLSALANMIAAGQDTKDGELRRRLDHMVDELDACQQKNGDGYVGGVPGGRALWKEVASGNVGAVNRKWVPWYNVHKTFAGLRDAYLVAGNAKARDVLLRLGDWVGRVTGGLSDAQMQRMLGQEHGGMNEVLADVCAITGDEKYLKLARRFSHRAVLDPLGRGEDRLTGLHANTQIPKVVGLERIATLAGDTQADAGARFFWETVSGRRSVAFGGNSVSEHFNDPKDFHGLLEHREGPETCNTYNMLRLTEQLFDAGPRAAYADYYERALFNHILASIHPDVPGYVYFTPIRPGHYRVYSQPDKGFWCCVGSGMENPGKYGRFIYARAKDGLYVNLFLASELDAPELGLKLRQETAFPDEERTRLTLHLERPSTFTLHVRNPGWTAPGAFAVEVNGEPVKVDSAPSSYAAIRREWKDGDRVEVRLPMRTTAEGLPDGSAWYAILRGPIVLASPSGTDHLDGLRAGAGRGDHIAGGPYVPLDATPALLTTAAELPSHVVPDPSAGPLRFRLMDVVEPPTKDGLPLLPFFRLHDARYQMYWPLTTRAELAARKERLAAAEREKLARDAATIDFVAVGEQQPEADHGLAGEGMDSGTFQGRRWRHGRWFQYTLRTRGAKAAELAITYSGWDRGRDFDVLANGRTLATVHLDGSRRGRFFEARYPIPADLLAAAPDGRLTIKLAAPSGLAGGIFDIRLLRPDAPGARPTTGSSD